MQEQGKKLKYPLYELLVLLSKSSVSEYNE